MRDKISRTVNFLSTHLRELIVVSSISLLVLIVILSLILLLQIDTNQKSIKNKLNQMNLQVLQIEKKILDLEGSNTEQKKINVQLSNEILNIQNLNQSDAESIGEITLIQLIDPLNKIKIDSTPSPDNRLVALEVSVLAINADITIRTIYFQIFYVDDKLLDSRSNIQNVTIKSAQKFYAGFESGLENKELTAGSGLLGWISFEIPEETRITGFSFDNGIVSANLKMPPVIR